jgi:hypothetical protein
LKPLNPGKHFRVLCLGDLVSRKHHWDQINPVQRPHSLDDEYFEQPLDCSYIEVTSLLTKVRVFSNVFGHCETKVADFT